ncbi:citrate lyase beta chain [Fusibacter sp. 3D3]|nr:citrate lyase beta chain [Fusibacter sp. 3D3]
MLFCPANNPKLYSTAPLLKPDCIIFDLEDSVAIEEKDSARDLLVEAVKFYNYPANEAVPEIFVRINALHTPYASLDVEAVVSSGLSKIRLPMCESEESILALDNLISELEDKYKIPSGSIKIQAAIETPKGVLNAESIAKASERVISLSFGAEDYTNCLGIHRLSEMPILDYARAHIALVCQAYGLDAIDTVWSDIADTEGFIKESNKVLNMGFSGKSCVHPSQLEPLHKVFTPSSHEIEKALHLIEQFNRNNEDHSGVALIDGKMVDKPIIERHKNIKKELTHEN